MRRLLVVVVAVTVAAYCGCGQTKSMKNFTHEEIVDLANGSYVLYGSTTTTARLIFHGLSRDHLDAWMLLAMADYFTETQPPVAAAIYYYLYQERTKFDEKLTKRFMTMFSDAMYQYGLSKHKSKKGTLTLGDLLKYENFDFDIAGLEKHAMETTKDFGSIEKLILIVESSLGMSCGFVERVQSKNLDDYLPEHVHLSKAYSEWLDGLPSEIEQIQARLRR